MLPGPAHSGVGRRGSTFWISGSAAHGSQTSHSRPRVLEIVRTGGLQTLRFFFYDDLAESAQQPYLALIRELGGDISLRAALLLLLTSLLAACYSEPRTMNEGVHAALPQSRLRALEPHGRGPCADDPRIGRVGFPGTLPVPVKRVEPSIERVAPGVRGVVVLDVVIDPEGVPCSVAVLRSVGSDADEAAASAVWQWRFKPATLQGHSWPAACNVSVRFPPGPGPSR